MSGGETNPGLNPERQPTPTRGVAVTLDKERHLRYSMRTMREMREEFGEDGLEKGVGTDSIAKLIWYGLKHEDPELTVEAVEEMIDLEHLTEIMQRVAIATGERARRELVVPGPQRPAPPAVAGKEENPSDTAENTPTSET